MGVIPRAYIKGRFLDTFGVPIFMYQFSNLIYRPSRCQHMGAGHGGSRFRCLRAAMNKIKLGKVIVFSGAEAGWYVIVRIVFRRQRLGLLFSWAVLLLRTAMLVMGVEPRWYRGMGPSPYDQADEIRGGNGRKCFGVLLWEELLEHVRRPWMRRAEVQLHSWGGLCKSYPLIRDVRVNYLQRMRLGKASEDWASKSLIQMFPNVLPQAGSIVRSQEIPLSNETVQSAHHMMTLIKDNYELQQHSNQSNNLVYVRVVNWIHNKDMTGIENVAKRCHCHVQLR